MGTKWRESKNMPDWTDVFTVMKAIEGLHSVTCFVTMTSAVFDGPAGFITIAMHRTAPIGEASVLGEPCLVTSGEWPCKDHSDLPSCLYAALLNCDQLLSTKLWHQLILPFTAEAPRA